MSEGSEQRFRLPRFWCEEAACETLRPPSRPCRLLDFAFHFDATGKGEGRTPHTTEVIQRCTSVRKIVLLPCHTDSTNISHSGPSLSCPKDRYCCVYLFKNIAPTKFPQRRGTLYDTYVSLLGCTHSPAVINMAVVSTVRAPYWI